MQHHITYGLTTPWLKQFVRNPYPKTVLWEDFEMDGRRRSGFYNLQVLARPSEQRTYYEMDIDQMWFHQGEQCGLHHDHEG